VKVILRCRIFLANSTSSSTDGGIVLENGFVSDMGKYGEIKVRTVGARTVEYDGIMCPALINAHTHLELSPFKSARPQHDSLSIPADRSISTPSKRDSKFVDRDPKDNTGGKVAHKDFVDWVLHLVAARSSRQYDDLSSECSKAKSEAEKSGTAYFVNVGNSLNLNMSLGKNQLFEFEQIGINNAAADGIFEKAVSLASGSVNPEVALGIHAPYSTSPSLMKQIKTYNNKRNAVTSIHLAETEDEVEFIRSGRGRMIDLLNARLGSGNWSFHGTASSPVEYVDSLGVLDEKTLCVHCVFVNEKDVAILKKRKCAVVVCARSNRCLTGSIPNVSEFVKKGIRVLLGTDSKASSPDIDMFEEMSAFYGEYHGLCNPSTVFRMATTDASDFLDINGFYGEIASGKRAPFVFAQFAGKAEDAFEYLVTEAGGKTEAISF
jgi:cytosine/adenosine deaminase-related metal-dependent hydrolase